jgi:hypothetical protein
MSRCGRLFNFPAWVRFWLVRDKARFFLAKGKCVPALAPALGDEGPTTGRSCRFVQQHELEAHFDFARYLTKCIRLMLLELIEARQHPRRCANFPAHRRSGSLVCVAGRDVGSAVRHACDQVHASSVRVCGTGGHQLRWLGCVCGLGPAVRQDPCHVEPCGAGARCVSSVRRCPDLE